MADTQSMHARSVKSDIMLDLKHITKTYTQGRLDVPVLKNVSFSIAQGEYVAIMGPSGSGKTTLMNIIGCLDYPTSGQYLLDGEDVSEYSETKLADVRLNSIGFVFQSFHLLARQSALDNVALPLLYAGVRKSDRDEIAKNALETVGLGDRLDFKPNQLSGGQSQRVAIARAMANAPKILLADEPTGALDSTSGEQIMELFQMLNNEGVTVIMITHDSEIAQHAKRVLRLKDGRLVDKRGNFIAPETMEEELGIEAPPEEALDEAPPKPKRKTALAPAAEVKPAPQVKPAPRQPTAASFAGEPKAKPVDIEAVFNPEAARKKDSTRNGGESS